VQPENEEYEKFEIDSLKDKYVLEMIVNQAGIYLLTADKLHESNHYECFLYHYLPSEDNLNVVDTRVVPDLMQTIYDFQNSLLWVASLNKETVNIYKYDSDNRLLETYAWKHNIDRPANYCPITSNITLKNDGDNLAIAVHFREIYGGGDIYVATGNFDYLEVEKSLEVPELSISHYPNPLSISDFNEGKKMNISFSLPHNGNVKIDVYNIRGQHIKTIASETYTTGTHTLSWNGKDNNNKIVSSGVYFYQININGDKTSSKMLVIK